MSHKVPFIKKEERHEEVTEVSTYIAETKDKPSLILVKSSTAMKSVAAFGQ